MLLVLVVLCCVYETGMIQCLEVTATGELSTSSMSLTAVLPPKEWRFATVSYLVTMNVPAMCTFSSWMRLFFSPLNVDAYHYSDVPQGKPETHTFKTWFGPCEIEELHDWPPFYNISLVVSLEHTNCTIQVVAMVTLTQVSNLMSNSSSPIEFRPITAGYTPFVINPSSNDSFVEPEDVGSAYNLTLTLSSIANTAMNIFAVAFSSSGCPGKDPNITFIIPDSAKSWSGGLQDTVLSTSSSLSSTTSNDPGHDDKSKSGLLLGLLLFFVITTIVLLSVVVAILLWRGHKNKMVAKESVNLINQQPELEIIVKTKPKRTKAT
ncbi:hypothetical protein Pelo_5059 [Pelomyxa schiedti]|nr:hypothetical protein Pelo_5059 [Pelomyxa schiedti]